MTVQEMTVQEAWEDFRAHMGIPNVAVPRASFYAGYVAGANHIYHAAAEALKKAQHDFSEQLSGELVAEMKPAGEKPS